MEVKNNEQNIAFIDGQNFYRGTMFAEKSWKVDLVRFRIYLQEKYQVKKAYYYIGVNEEIRTELYKMIQEAGFILIFRKHNTKSESAKKGNIDVDLTFDVMKQICCEKSIKGKVILVSGDGDYIKLVEYLISINKFEKVLFPNKRFASSLYRRITEKYRDNLDKDNIKKKIEYKIKKEA